VNCTVGKRSGKESRLERCQLKYIAWRQPCTDQHPTAPGEIGRTSALGGSRLDLKVPNLVPLFWPTGAGHVRVSAVALDRDPHQPQTPGEPALWRSMSQLPSVVAVPGNCHCQNKQNLSFVDRGRQPGRGLRKRP